MNQKIIYSLLILLIASAFNKELHAQTNDLDSLKEKILRMDVAINNMHNNMVKSHREFKPGVWMMILGSVISTIGLANNDTPNSVTNPLIYLGSGMSLGGCILVIDSHKYFGYGGRRSKKKR